MNIIREAGRDAVGDNDITVDRIRSRYDEFNRKLFGGELPGPPMVTFKTNRRTRSFGRTVGKFSKGIAKPRVSNYYLDSYKDLESLKLLSFIEVQISTFFNMEPAHFDGILAHEMVHVWCFANGYIWGNHGAVFMEKLKKIQGKADFKIPTKDDIDDLPKSDDAETPKRRVLGILMSKKNDMSDLSAMGVAIMSQKLIPKNDKEAAEIAKNIGISKRMGMVSIYDLSTTLYASMPVQRASKRVRAYNCTQSDIDDIVKNGKLLSVWHSEK